MNRAADFSDPAPSWLPRGAECDRARVSGGRGAGLSMTADMYLRGLRPLRVDKGAFRGYVPLRERNRSRVG